MIYCDSAATTPLNENVMIEMNKISSTVIGNPTSIHTVSYTQLTLPTSDLV